MNLSNIILVALCAIVTLTGCQERRVDVYIHEDTGCQSDSDCDAAYDSDTFAWCDMEADNGTCHYQTYVEQPSCYGSWDCDDGDPTSTDTCSTEGCTHVIREIAQPAGIDAIVSLKSTCDFGDRTPSANIHTGELGYIQCYNVQVLTETQMHWWEMTFYTPEYAADAFRGIRVIVNGAVATDFASPESFANGIATWHVSAANPIPLLWNQNTICLQADVLNAESNPRIGWYIRADLAGFGMVDNSRTYRPFGFGEQTTILSGDERTITRSSVNVLAQQPTATNVNASTETEIGKFLIYSTSEEGYTTSLHYMTFDIACAYSFGGRTLRVYRGSSNTPVTQVTITPNNQAIVDLSVLGEIGLSGTVIRLSIDTTVFQAGTTHFLQTSVNEYRWTDGRTLTQTRNNECGSQGNIAIATGLLVSN